MNWKSIVKDLKAMYDEHKGAVVAINLTQDPNKQHPVQITSDVHALTFEGMDINPKLVRRWLWEQRNTRAVKREGNFIWASYNAEDDTTLVGLGALATSRAAVRLDNIREKAA